MKRTIRGKFAPVERELLAAENSLRRMVEGTTYEDSDSAWRSFLGNVTKAFSKMQRVTRTNARAKTILDRVLATQKSDELLTYIFQARNSDQHTENEQLTIESTGLRISTPPGETTTIKKLRFSEHGEYEGMEFDGARPTIELRDPRIRLVMLTNRGTTYLPPSSHLSATIPPERHRDPAHVGTLALRFYAAVLCELKGLYTP